MNLKILCGLLGHKGTFLSHGQPVSTNSQVLLCNAAFQQVSPNLYWYLGVVPLQVQDPTLAFVELHQILLCPALQPVQVSLNGSTAFWCVSPSSQLGVISKLAGSALSLLIQVTDEQAEQDWNQY